MAKGGYLEIAKLVVVITKIKILNLRLRTREESNLHRQGRNLLFYPLNYGSNKKDTKPQFL